MMADDRAWWIVVTQPSCERKAASALQDHGFEVWLPTRVVRFKTRYMRRPAERPYPQFPGYVFARSSGSRPVFRYGRIDGHLCRIGMGQEPHNHDWREIAGLDSCRAILSNDYRPSVFKNDQVQRLREHLDKIALETIDMALWRTDDMARICDGPFTGFTVKVARSEQRGSIAVLMSFFGRGSIVEMPVEHLAKVA